MLFQALPVTANEDEDECTDFTMDWDQVREATHAETAQGSDALSRLIERYRPWMLTRLASRFQFKNDEFQDTLHSFIEQKILKGGLLNRADPRRGSFRAFLRNALDNFAVSEIRSRKAHKRSPGTEFLSLDSLSPSELLIESAPFTPERDIVWAQAVIAGALLDMRLELARLNRLDIWEVFEGRVLQPILNDESPLDYSSIIARFNYDSLCQALNTLVTAKRMFRRHLRAVVSQYTHDETQVDEELACLANRLAMLKLKSTEPATPHLSSLSV